MSQEALGGLVKPLRAFQRLLTAAVTADPAFMLRNFVRDALHAWTISEHAFRPGVDSVRGALKTLRESGGLRDMMFAGASFMGGYVNAGDPGEVARAIRRALRARGYDAAAADRYLATVLDTPGSGRSTGASGMPSRTPTARRPSRRPCARPAPRPRLPTRPKT